MVEQSDFARRRRNARCEGNLGARYGLLPLGLLCVYVCVCVYIPGLHRCFPNLTLGIMLMIDD